MTTTPDIKVSDEVRVFSYNKYRPDPEGGYVATVTRVGRRYATAGWETTETTWNGEPRRYAHTIEFDMETGREKGTSGSGRSVKTPEQAEQDARERAAIASLLARKIRLDYGHGFTVEQIEALAALVATFDQTEG
jgi:hypothetical protein